MRDTGIRQHALQTGLGQRHDIAQNHAEGERAPTTVLPSVALHGARAMTNTRIRPANAAALTAADMKAVMDVGAPS